MNKEKLNKLVKEISRIIRNNDLSYDEFNEVNRLSRKVTGLTAPKRRKQFHVLPTHEELSKFLDVLAGAPLKHELMIKLLWFTGLRNFEMCNIRMNEVDLNEAGMEKILIHGKGGYDRFVAIPPKLARDLKRYMKDVSNNIWLFESRIGKPYTTAGFRKIVRKYRDLAGLSDKIYPHNFRHLVGTEAIKLGFSKEEVQNILRHTSIKSTDIYTNTNQEWTRDIGIKLEQQFNSY